MNSRRTYYLVPPVTVGLLSHNVVFEVQVSYFQFSGGWHQQYAAFTCAMTESTIPHVLNLSDICAVQALQGNGCSSLCSRRGLHLQHSLKTAMLLERQTAEQEVANDVRGSEGYPDGANYAGECSATKAAVGAGVRSTLTRWPRGPGLGPRGHKEVGKTTASRRNNRSRLNNSFCDKARAWNAARSAAPCLGQRPSLLGAAGRARCVRQGCDHGGGEFLMSDAHAAPVRSDGAGVGRARSDPRALVRSRRSLFLPEG